MGPNVTRKHEKRSGERMKVDRPGVGRKWILGAILAVAIAAGVGAWHWRSTIWAYKMAPSFTLQASTGRLVSLQDYQGKQEVVLIFYMGAG